MTPSHRRFSLIEYTPGMARAWDRFAAESKNALFIHRRPYMDYHADRFPDRSLVVMRGNSPYSLFPATAPERGNGAVVTSHAGLTYASLITSSRADTEGVLTAMDLIAAHYRKAGYSRLVCSPVPGHFHTLPADEDLYALFRLGAKLTMRRPTTVVDLSNPLPWRRIRIAGLTKAADARLEISSHPDPAVFWPLLRDTLARRHNAVPVHSEAEISLLAKRFPANIVTFTVHEPGSREPVAGTVVYADRHVARAQYIAASQRGRECGALDFLFHRLLTDTFPKTWKFDFGTSCIPGTSRPNLPLLYQKEGFGGRTVVCDTYSLDL